MDVGFMLFELFLLLFLIQFIFRLEFFFVVRQPVFNFNVIWYTQQSTHIFVSAPWMCITFSKQTWAFLSFSLFHSTDLLAHYNKSSLICLQNGSRKCILKRREGILFMCEKYQNNMIPTIFRNLCIQILVCATTK